MRRRSSAALRRATIAGRHTGILRLVAQEHGRAATARRRAGLPAVAD